MIAGVLCYMLQCWGWGLVPSLSSKNVIFWRRNLRSLEFHCLNCQNITFFLSFEVRYFHKFRVLILLQ